LGNGCILPLVTSKDALHPRNLRFLRHRRITSTQRTSVVKHAEDPGKRLILMTRLVGLSVCRDKQSAVAHKKTKVEPPILPSPRMAEDAAEVRNLRCAQPEGPPTEKRRRIGNRASQETSRTAELRNPRRVRAMEPPTHKVSKDPRPGRGSKPPTG